MDDDLTTQEWSRQFLGYIEECASEALKFHKLHEEDRKLIEAGLVRLRPAFEAGDIGRTMAWGFVIGSKAIVPDSAESYNQSKRTKGKGRAPDPINQDIMKILLEPGPELSAGKIGNRLRQPIGAAWYTRVSRVKKALQKKSNV